MRAQSEERHGRDLYILAHTYTMMNAVAEIAVDAMNKEEENPVVWAKINLLFLFDLSSPS